MYLETYSEEMIMNRVNVQQAQPEAYNAMFGLEKYLATSTIACDLQELIRIRASVINQCQFCIGMHTEAAIKLGISGEKIQAVSNWQSSALFSDKEQAVLKMTDCMTNINAQGLPNEIYQSVVEYFSEEEIAQLIMLNATINAWNRIGISMSDN